MLESNYFVETVASVSLLCVRYFYFTMAQQSPVGQGPLIIEDSLSHSAHHTRRLLWTSDQLVAETSTWQHTTLTIDKHPCLRRDLNPHSQQASGRRTVIKYFYGDEIKKGETDLKPLRNVRNARKSFVGETWSEEALVRNLS
jgi:hypothetical protein